MHPKGSSPGDCYQPGAKIGSVHANDNFWPLVANFLMISAYSHIKFTLLALAQLVKQAYATKSSVLQLEEGRRLTMRCGDLEQ